MASGDRLKLMESARQVDKKRRSVALLALGADGSAVAFNDLSTNGQADPGALVAGSPVQPLEDREDLLGVFLVKADPGVSYRDKPPRTDQNRFDPNIETTVVLSELQCIPDQVLQ